MAPLSFAKICVKVAATHIKILPGFGDIPLYGKMRDHIREILGAVKAAQHLRSIELGTTDPTIYEETEAVWKRLIHKQFPSLERQHSWAPDKPENWHKVWDRYQQASDAADAAAIAKLKAAVAANDQKKESNKATIVNASEVGRLGAKEPRKTTHWSASTEKKNPNKTFFEKTRNQLRKEARCFQTKPRNPPKDLGKVDHAPASMLGEKRFEGHQNGIIIGRERNPFKLIDATQQIDATQRIRLPRIRASADSESLVAARHRERKEREERLLRIKKSPSPPTILHFGDDTNNSGSGTLRQGDDFDDLFDEPPSKIKSSATPAKAKSSKRQLESDDLFGDEPPSKKIKPSAASGMAKSSLLDINSIEALHTESSASSSARNSPNSSRPPAPGPPSGRRRGGLLSAAPVACKTTTSVTTSRTAKSPPAVGKSTAATSSPTFRPSGNRPGSIDAPAATHKPLSAMTPEDAQNLEQSLRGTGVKSAGQAEPRRVVKRRRPDPILVPNKRVHR